MADLFKRKWGQMRTGIIERERRRRILLAVWAYAYEFEHDPLVDDATFDRECYLVNPSIDTGRANLDHFFRTGFEPHTGQWIHDHPELSKVRTMYEHCVSARRRNSKGVSAR